MSDPSTVFQTASLLLYGSFGFVVPETGFLRLSLPPELSLSDGDLTCTLREQEGAIRTCTATSNVIQVSFTQDISATSFELTFEDCVTNPSSTLETSSFTFELFSDSSSRVEEISSGLTLSATPDTLASFQMTPLSKVLGDSTSVEIAFQPKNRIPVNGYLQLVVPVWNNQAPEGSQLSFIQGAYECQPEAVLSSETSCFLENNVLQVTQGIQS